MDRSTKKWTKISTNACGKGTYEMDGWIIQHCGHPTANYPYMLYDPDGHRHLAANGRGHQTLAAAKEFQGKVSNEPIGS